MKKSFIISILLTILLGAIFGKVLYNHYEEETVMGEDSSIYLLQYGVYTTEEEANKEHEQITPSIVIKEEDKYYLYLGMSLKKSLLEKVKSYYDQENKVTYIKEEALLNSTFSNHLSQWDILLSNATTKEEVKSVCEVVLADYEETVLMK